jgi:hypothetical protein
MPSHKISLLSAVALAESAAAVAPSSGESSAFLQTQTANTEYQNPNLMPGGVSGVLGETSIAKDAIAIRSWSFLKTSMSNLGSQTRELIQVRGET